MLTHVSLFSGIGAFDKAAERAGFKTVMLCEIDPYCQRILKHHWPGTPIINDVKEVTGDTIRKYTATLSLLTGSPPCQPVSCAGKRRGAADDRYLWPEVIRIVKESRPSWFCFENPTGFITMGLDGVLSDLEGAGYSCQTAIIPACAVNAPHRRDRLWIVGHASERGLSGVNGRRSGEESQDGLGQLAEGTVTNPTNHIRQSGVPQQEQRGMGNETQSITTDAEKQGCEGAEPTGRVCAGRCATAFGSAYGSRNPQPGFRMLDDGPAEGLAGFARPLPTPNTRDTRRGCNQKQVTHIADQLGNCGATGEGEGLPDWCGGDWQMPPPLAHKPPERVNRIKALGNSFVWGQVYPILQAIATYEQGGVL